MDKSRVNPVPSSVAPPDDLDRRLILLLQANARDSTATLARKLGVARTTVVARLARLEASGRIVGYTARLGGD
ncbi:AsnC family transcriptional regulator, partial [Klebsiella pneumoniae]|uniref:AsnC family transcriptional regulator n=2 Tax=Klebsiella TaxID=570 RepID=UPI00272F7561